MAYGWGKKRYLVLESRDLSRMALISKLYDERVPKTYRENTILQDSKSEVQYIQPCIPLLENVDYLPFV